MSVLSNIIQIDPNIDSLQQAFNKLSTNFSYIEELVHTSIIKGEISDLSQALTSDSNSVTIDASCNTVPIGIEGYNKDTCTLMVYQNNKPLVEGVDYSISSDSQNIIKTSGTWSIGTFIDFAEMAISPDASGVLFKAITKYTDVHVQREVFTIVNANTGSGHFLYQDSGNNLITGDLAQDGGQIFVLQKGEYVLNDNRIDIIVNDTLKRSLASGGLIELDSKRVCLTMPESNGSEITIEYYSQLSLGTGSTNQVDTTPYIGVGQPPSTSTASFWYKELT